MGSPWLPTGSYSVRMKRTAPKKLSKCLPDLWDTIKTSNTQNNTHNTTNEGHQKRALHPSGTALNLGGIAQDENNEIIPFGLTPESGSRAITASKARSKRWIDRCPLD